MVDLYGVSDFYEWIFLISGVIFFISIIGIFLSAAKINERLIRRFGIITVSLLLPLIILFINFVIVRKDAKILLYTVLIITYLAVEVLLDFIFKVEFRDKPSTHIPYIVLEYIACFSFIFASIEINYIMGWVLSVFFWLMLVALIYYMIMKSKRES